MNTKNILIIGQSHSTHFHSFIKYIDKYLDNIDKPNKNINYKFYIVNSYPYPVGINQNFGRKFEIIDIPNKINTQKIALKKRLKILLMRFFICLPNNLKRLFKKDLKRIDLIKIDSKLNIFSPYPEEIYSPDSEKRMIDKAYPHRFAHTLSLNFENIKIFKVKFQAIFLIDAQSAGYFYLQIKSMINNNGKIFLITYGVDFLDYIYRKNHKNKLVKLLKDIDYLQVETLRDINLSRKLNYKKFVFNPSHATYRELDSLPDIRDAVKKFDFIITGSLISRIKFKKCIKYIVNYLQYNNFLQFNKILIFRSLPEDAKIIREILNDDIQVIDYGPEIEQKKLHKIFSESKFFLHPSNADGVSNCCLEAIYCDCLTITTQNNGFKELIPSEIRHLFISGNDEEYDLFKLMFKIQQCKKSDINSFKIQIKDSIKKYLDSSKYNLILEKILN